MGMVWLLLLVVIVMLSGLIATFIIGQSKSNREENPNYDQNTGRKWIRLSGIYIISIVLVAILLIIFLNR
jgi:formate hydrogenlyase subunit 3/multisubunit Na+/H+ antiporter MnhD subunit